MREFTYGSGRSFGSGQVVPFGGDDIHVPHAIAVGLDGFVFHVVLVLLGQVRFDLRHGLRVQPAETGYSSRVRPVRCVVTRSGMWGRCCAWARSSESAWEMSIYCDSISS